MLAWRRVAPAPVAGRTSCGTLEATDSLNAFTWECDNSLGTPRMVSVGLNTGASLATLLDTNAIAWQSLSLTVADANGTVFTTTPAIWWSNPVRAQTLGTLPSGIAIGDGSVAGVYTLNAAHTALVVPAGAAANVQITSGFTWLEGEFAGVNVQNSNDVLLRNISVDAANANNIILSNVNHSLLMNVLSVGAAGDNLLLNQASFNNIKVLVTDSAGANNIDVINLSSNNVFSTVVTTRAVGAGLYVASGGNDTFIQVKAADNTGIGVELFSTTATVINSAFLTSNGQANLSLSAAKDAVITNLTAATSQFQEGAGINGSNHVLLQNVLSVYNLNGVGFTGDTNCTLVNVLNANNRNLGFSSTGSTGTQSWGLQAANANVTGTFVGAVSSAPYASVTDWTQSASPYEAWGVPALTGGPCTSGTCDLFDWRLSATDTTALNAVQSLAQVTHTFSTGVTVTFLVGATEVMEDSLGNDNGLCESGEVCLQTFNPGAYQGQGALLTDPTSPPSGYTLVTYSSNGS